VQGQGSDGGDASDGEGSRVMGLTMERIECEGPKGLIV
jgi:hypothetical protein